MDRGKMRLHKIFIGATWLLMFLCSCQNNHKDEITQIVSDWVGKEIRFPEGLPFMVNGKDTMDFSGVDALHKIVVYVDSLGCMSCRLNLPLWSDFIHELDSLTDSQVCFLFYLQPKSVKELNLITRRDSFNYPVCVDIDDNFNKLNHLPKDDDFRAFLLNEYNRVEVIGNPIHNSKIKELYINVIRGELSQRDVKKETIVDFEDEFDWGICTLKTSYSHIFRLTNKGKKPLLIYGLRSSCSCIHAELSDSIVSPGGEGIVKVVYTPDHIGHFNKTVTIYSNAENSPIHIKVKGMVVD